MRKTLPGRTRQAGREGRRRMSTKSSEMDVGRVPPPVDRETSDSFSLFVEAFIRKKARHDDATAGDRQRANHARAQRAFMLDVMGRNGATCVPFAFDGRDMFVRRKTVTSVRTVTDPAFSSALSGVTRESVLKRCALLSAERKSAEVQGSAEMKRGEGATSTSLSSSSSHDAPRAIFAEALAIELEVQLKRLLSVKTESVCVVPHAERRESTEEKDASQAIPTLDRDALVDTAIELLRSKVEEDGGSRRRREMDEFDNKAMEAESSSVLEALQRRNPEAGVQKVRVWRPGGRIAVCYVRRRSRLKAPKVSPAFVRKHRIVQEAVKRLLNADVEVSLESLLDGFGDARFADALRREFSSVLSALVSLSSTRSEYVSIDHLQLSESDGSG